MSGFVRFVAAVAVCLFAPNVVRADVAGTVRVVDGDTFVVGGTTVRLHGIDAPERDQTCRSRADAQWPCGAWVSDKVRARFTDRMARCEALDQDRYGRVVARCWIDGKEVGRQLVAEGLAFAYRKYAMDYDEVEKEAARRDLGLHTSTMLRPDQFRKTRSQRKEPSGRACAIKGNISRNGERIYHTPGQRDYQRTRIRPEKGELWFCTVQAAEAAGWRAARR